MRLLQADRGITLAGLAYDTGMPYGRLSLMRRGLLVPKGYQVDALAKALEVRPVMLKSKLRVERVR